VQPEVAQLEALQPEGVQPEVVRPEATPDPDPEPTPAAVSVEKLRSDGGALTELAPVSELPDASPARSADGPTLGVGADDDDSVGFDPVPVELESSRRRRRGLGTRQKPSPDAAATEVVEPQPASGEEVGPSSDATLAAAEPDASRTAPERRAPLYWRVLRLRHVHPNGWQRAVLLEGMVAAALVLVLAGVASLWTLLALPVVAALLVKIHDLLVGGMHRVATPRDDEAEVGAKHRA
jgi:hypothetical protein